MLTEYRNQALDLFSRKIVIIKTLILQPSRHGTGQCGCVAITASDRIIRGGVHPNTDCVQPRGDKVVTYRMAKFLIKRSLTTEDILDFYISALIFVDQNYASIIQDYNKTDCMHYFCHA